MKCPERYRVTQINIRKPIKNEYEDIRGEYRILIENQGYAKCYEAECAAWDKENQRGRKVGV